MTLRKLVLAAALVAAFSLSAFGQNGPFGDVIQNRNGTPLSGALVKICTKDALVTGSAAAMTCSPLVPAIYNQAAVGATKLNPLTTNAEGEYTGWLPPGLYKGVAVLGASAKSFDFSVAQVSGDDITVSNMFLSGYVEGIEIATPIAPAAGKVRWYAKATGELCKQNSSAVEVCVGGSSSGDVTGVTLSAPADFTVTGSPCTTGDCAITLAFATTPTGTSAFVRRDSPTFTTQITTPKLVTTGASEFDGIEAAAPGSPAATHWKLYPKTSAGWCQKNSAGSETCMAANLASPAFLWTTCTGTSTSSTTLTLQGFGTLTGNCNGTTTSRAMRVGTGGTLKNLYVIADAGVNASSGAFTVYQCTAANYPACTSVTSTGITCTVGTSASGCSDLTHAFAINGGDAIVIKYTTQATETLGNINLSLEKQ